MVISSKERVTKMQKRLLGLIAFIAVVGSSFYLGMQISEDPEPYVPVDIEPNDVFNDVFDTLQGNHYTQPDADALWQGAIDGIISTLGDPYTFYFDFEEYSQYQSNFGESYVGIGVSVRYQDDLVVVEEVKSGGPADQAGVLPNDIIAEVDGETVAGDAFYEIINNIIGEEGTDVTIGILRQGVDSIIPLTMTRAVIDNSTVNYTTYTKDGLTFGYIEVTTFGTQTFQKFSDAIYELEQLEIDGMIIDLRDNGGGRLNTVYNMMNQFLIDNGKEMFSTEEYDEGEFLVTEYRATGNDRKDYNIVTLVNANSASASEVFSSGMQEQGGYPVIGVTTFGKGTMQTDLPIQATENDLIHITIGKWLTADGNWVNTEGGTGGVVPDVIVEATVYEKAYKLFLFDGEELIYDTVDSRTMNLQYILNTMGYDVREDGYFDQETKDAIMDIETTNGLTVDGNVDPLVLEIINDALDLFQDDPESDTQLQAAIDYLINNPLDE